MDETGHKENGQRLWTWCFRAPLITLFKISPSRGSEVLLQTLGLEFNGVLGCDYYSAYHKYMRLNENVLVQFCLAHLIRDVRFLVGHPVVVYSTRMRPLAERLSATGGAWSRWRVCYPAVICCAAARVDRVARWLAAAGRVLPPVSRSSSCRWSTSL